MDLGLKDKTVLVTGSTRGIGLGIARMFLSEGARVMITGLNQARLADAANGLKKRFGSPNVMTSAGDLADPTVRDGVADAIAGKWKRLDVLVANLGSGRSVPPLEEDQDEWQRMLDINLLTATGCVQRFLPLLEAAAGSDGQASVVLISSICGIEALGCPVAYSSAKAALNAYAKNISRPLGARGVRVNVVSPGNVLFPGSTWEDKLAADAEGVMAMLNREVPLARLGTVDEIAAAVVFLTSVRASFITGAEIVVDGGQTRLL